MALSRIITQWLTNYDNQKSLGAKLRTKRIAPLLRLIELVYQKNGSVNIVDVGGTRAYWQIVSSRYLHERNVSITIVNLPGTENAEDHGPFKFVEADACDLDRFENKSFDIAHANSVVEHVGDWTRMVAFAAELKRVSRRYFCQTPNYWFPVEPHCMTPFFHWLPNPSRLWLVSHFQLGHWARAASTDEAVRTVESARLLNRKMMHSLFPDATVSTERILGLAKSFVAVKS